MASNCPSDNTEFRIQSEVVGISATRPKADSQLVIGTGEGTEAENGQGASRDEGRPVDGCKPVSVDEDINETPVPGTEVEGEGDLTLTAF